MFNPVLQQTISPVQEAVVPSGATFAAGALGSLLDLGQGMLEKNMLEQQAQAEMQQKQQEALVDERVSAAALGLADILANASGRNKTSVQQRLNDQVVKLRDNGFSETEIAAALKQANTLSGTSLSASIRLERDETQEMEEAERQFRQDYAAIIPFIPNEYLNDDNTAPMDDRAKMEAAMIAAQVNRASFEERKLRAQTLSSEANLRESQRQELSQIVSQEYNILLSGVIRDSMAKLANDPNATEQDKQQAVMAGRLMVEKAINNDSRLLASERQNLITGLNAVSTMMEDVLTGKMAADYTVKQQSAMMTRVLNTALKTSPETFGLFLYSKMGLRPPDVAFQNIPVETFHAIAYGNPNSNTPPPSGLQPIETKELWKAIATPEKKIDDPTVAQSFVDVLLRGFQANTQQEVRSMLDKDGTYLWAIETIGNKDIADKYTDAVLGNQDFLDSFSKASGNALEVYIPLALNQVAESRLFGDDKVKSSMIVRVDGKYPQVSLPNVREGRVVSSSSFSPRVDTSISYENATRGVRNLNRILRLQYEAAVNIDRVAGTNYAEQLKNTQIQMLRQFVQE